MIPTIQSSIPDDWRAQELGSLCSRIVGGGTPSRNVKHFWDGDIPWATVKDISGFSATNTIEHISKEAVNKSATQVIPSGTIIIATRMSVGNPVIYSVDTAINQDLKALFTRDDVNKEYLVYFLRAITPMLDEIASGTTVKGLSLDVLTKQKILMPANEAEQRAIATTLADVDALIEAKKALLEKKRAIKQGAMQELLTGKRRLPGFPVTPMKNTEIGEIPEDWELSPITRLMQTVRPPYKLEESSYLDAGDYPIITQGADLITAYCNDENFLLPNGDYILFGDHTCFVKKYSGSFAQGADGLKILHTNDSLIHFSFAYYAFSYRAPKPTGYNRHWSMAKKIVLAIPLNKEEQTAIALTLSDMDSEIDSLDEEIVKLRNLKQGMMQELLTGRIRLV